jgi:glutamate carboxypeptidase
LFSTQLNANTLNFAAESFLKELVETNSDTANVAGVNECQEKIALKLKSLGFKNNFIKQPLKSISTGDLLVSELKGKSDKFITLLMHSDTVFPISTGFLNYKIENEKAFGPGIIDDKGGIVVAINALSILLEQNIDMLKYSLRVIISPAEEIGSTGFLDIFSEYAKDTEYLLGFEPALENGSIISSRRGDRWYDIKITGIEAHAGRNHKKGANACHELAIKISKLHELTNYKKSISINIGHIEGGKDKFAIVCGEASAKLDVRFSDLKNRSELIQKIDRILNTTYVKSFENKTPTHTIFKIVDDPIPFSPTSKSIKTAEKHLEFIEKYEERKSKNELSGGTADSNFFFRKGITILDGLGPVGGNMHRNDEYILLKSIETRAKAVSDLLKYLQRE